jgi:hypothetical protein
MLPVLSDARFYRERGLSIVPIRPGTKAAAADWKEFQERLPTSGEIERWWTQTRHGIAIVCGRVSGVVAVDADSEDKTRELSRRLPKTEAMTRSSPGKGHLYYRIAEGVVVPTRIRLGGMLVDLKAEGSYCLAAHSVHPVTGQPYARIGSWDMEKVPYFDRSWIDDVAPDQRRIPDRLVGDEVDVLSRIARARVYLTRLEPAIAGQGGHNRTMCAAGCLVQKFGLTIEQAWPLLLEFNDTKCSPKWTARELLHKLESAVQNLHATG